MSLPKKYTLNSIGLSDYLNESEIKVIQADAVKMSNYRITFILESLIWLLDRVV